MKILMLGWELPPYNSGGLGVACFELAKALTLAGSQVTFVLPKKLNLTSPFFEIIYADTNESSIPEFYKYFSAYKPSMTIEALKNHLPDNLKKPDLVFEDYPQSLIYEVLQYAQNIQNVTQKQDFDVIHAHDWLTYPAGIEAKKQTHKPLIVHVHATEFDRTGGNINQTIYEIEKDGFQKADGIIAVSNYTKNVITDKYGISPSKIKVVHNGIEQANYSVPTDPDYDFENLKRAGFKIVLFVGRITLQKGPDYFIKAAKKVLEYDPKVIFVIAGAGDMQHWLIEEVARLGISSNVIFTGFLRDEKLSSVYRSADLFVLPSVSEPFGIAPLEAVTNSTPVLISKQSGVSEILTHSLKTDFWDTDDIADKILSVVSHTSLKNTLRDNSSNEVRGITWSKAADKCMGVYQQMIG